jgi:hypothetical protein
MTWPPVLIREFLERAVFLGTASIHAQTRREAELLRYAIYRFRNKTNIGRLLTLTIENTNVVARSEPKLSIVEESTENAREF